MSAVPLSRPSTVDRLAACVSRITVRYGSSRPRYRKRNYEMTGYPEGHGEKIWIFSNVRSKQVAYSHFPVLDVRCLDIAMCPLSFGGSALRLGY